MSPKGSSASVQPFDGSSSVGSASSNAPSPPRSVPAALLTSGTSALLTSGGPSRFGRPHMAAAATASATVQQLLGDAGLLAAELDLLAEDSAAKVPEASKPPRLPASLSSDQVLAHAVEREEAERLHLSLYALVRELRLYAQRVGSRRQQALLLSAAATLRIASSQLLFVRQQWPAQQKHVSDSCHQVQVRERLLFVSVSGSLCRVLDLCMMSFHSLCSLQEALVGVVSSLVAQVRHALARKERLDASENPSIPDCNIWQEEPDAPGCVILFAEQKLSQISANNSPVPSSGGFMPTSAASPSEEPRATNSVSNLPLRAGTLNQLVGRITSERLHDVTFVKAIILTLDSFATPETLFEKLEQRYDVPQSRKPPKMSNADWNS
jgi:hypothetical protein